MSVTESLISYLKAIKTAQRSTKCSSIEAAASVIRARLKYGMGPLYHSLFRLAQVPESQWRDFIPDQESNPIISRINGKDSIFLATNKLLFTAHCNKQGLPVLPILGVISSNIIPESSFPSIADVEALTSLLTSSTEAMFVKKIDGSHGKGAFQIRPNTGSTWFFNDCVGSSEDIYNHCVLDQGQKAAWIIQPICSLHADLLEIMPNGTLGTIRVITYMSQYGPQLLLPFLRIPTVGNITDNFSDGRSGNLVAAIDPKTGILGPARYSIRTDWPEITDIKTHPDTKKEIQGRCIPYWDDTKKLILQAQERTPLLRTAGWDIAITQTGPQIVEANAGYGSNGLQVAHGRGVRSDLTPVLLLDSQL